MQFRTADRGLRRGFFDQSIESRAACLCSLRAVAVLYPVTIPRFEETPWSSVECAGQAKMSARRREALEFICRTYRPPLLQQLLGWGYSMPDAEDLVQGFFLYFIRANVVARADRRKGRFRSFLIAVLRHYVAKQRLHARLKRGGDCSFVSVEEPENGALALPAADVPSPVPQCDREWAAEIAQRALVRLRDAPAEVAAPGDDFALRSLPDAGALSRAAAGRGGEVRSARRGDGRMGLPEGVNLRLGRRGR